MTARRRDDSGMTLIELLVVMLLIGAIGTVFATGVIGGTKAGKGVADRSEASAQLQIAAERIAREIRVADPVEIGTASGTGLQARVYRNGVCTRYIYRVVGTQLVQYTQGPLTPAPLAVGSPTLNDTCTTPAATEPPPAALPSRVMVTDLAPGTVFSYFDRTSAPINFAVSPRPSEKLIAAVEIRLVQTNAARGALQVSTRVAIRNIPRSTL